MANPRTSSARRHARNFFAASLLGGVGLIACSTAPAPPAPALPPGMDEAALLSVLHTFRTSPGFTRVSSKVPYVSSLGPDIYLNVYVSTDAFAEYAAIDPAHDGSGVKMPVGGYIVREVVDRNGETRKLTLIVKGPAGYNPALGDYWFGVTAPDGTPVADMGVHKTGLVTECYGCHLPRAHDDYLFGVPLDQRDRADPPPTDPTPPWTPPPTPPDAPPATPPDAAPPPPDQPVCGDFVCEPGESCETCPSDCRGGDGDDSCNKDGGHH